MRLRNETSHDKNSIILKKILWDENQETMKRTNRTIAKFGVSDQEWETYRKIIQSTIILI